MNASIVRMKKEARALFWPWCAVMAAGAVPLLWDPFRFRFLGLAVFAAVTPLSFFVGLPLLAALSFGNEFQHRTLPVLLAQPVHRLQVWREKLLVMVFAVISAGMVFYWSAPSGLRQEQVALAGLYVLTMTAGAAFWTLLARSTIGGLALGWLMFGAFELAGAILDFFSGSVYDTAGRFMSGKLPPQETATILFYVSLAAVSYSGLLLWLGARKLARFQATGEAAGEDLVLAGSKFLPEALAGWFRYRSAEPYWNLIRKELRLLQPVWLMGMLLFLYLLFLAVFRLFPDAAEQAPRGQIPLRIAMWIPVVALTPVMALLAGCLSLGEERTSGTYSWHMTLPVSSRRQWLIKLLVAQFTGVVCAVLLPVSVLLAYGFVFGLPVRGMGLVNGIFVASILILVSFWCACAVSGTVRAALWVFPVMGTLLLVGRFGADSAGRVISFLASRLDLFADFGFTNTVSNGPLYVPSVMPLWAITLLLLPTAAMAVIQSYRLFRAQPRENPVAVIRHLMPMGVIAFLWLFSLGASEAAVFHAKGQMWTWFHETHEAIEKIQPDATGLELSGPIELTVDDLAKVAPLSERTRRWLANSRITVAPDKPGSSLYYCCWANSRGIRLTPGKTFAWYMATIHRPGGSTCTLSFQAVRGYGILGGVCQ